jgi:hypothetical protein
MYVSSRNPPGKARRNFLRALSACGVVGWRVAEERFVLRLSALSACEDGRGRGLVAVLVTIGQVSVAIAVPVGGSRPRSRGGLGWINSTIRIVRVTKYLKALDVASIRTLSDARPSG